MAKKTTKKQLARELALSALAEKIAKQEKIQDATQRAFLAQADFEEVRSHFASALQELDHLGESHTWMRDSFDLSASDLKALLSLSIGVTNDGDESSTDSEGSETGKEHHEEDPPDHFEHDEHQ